MSGQCLVLVFTCVDTTFAASCISDSTSEARAVTTTAEARKREKYVLLSRSLPPSSQSSLRNRQWTLLGHSYQRTNSWSKWKRKSRMGTRQRLTVPEGHQQTKVCQKGISLLLWSVWMDAMYLLEYQY